MGAGSFKTIKIEHISGTPLTGSAYTVNSQGELLPIDFKSVAKDLI